MSKRASPTIIGGFIVGSIVLTIVGILIFGSNKFMSDEVSYVLNFEGSVKGLDIGSPVVFRGVKVGVVSNIKLVVSVEENDIRIPVTINIDPSTLTQDGSNSNNNVRRYINQMIKSGLKAELKMQSLITGKLIIELEFNPDEVPQKTIYAGDEIPTNQSMIKKLAKKIEELQLEEFPIEEVLHNGVRAIQAIEKILTSPSLMGSIEGLNGTLKVVQRLGENMEIRMGPFMNDMQKTMNVVQKLAGHLDNRMGPLADSLQETMETSRVFAKTAEGTLKVIENIASENSALRYQLLDGFEQLTAASRSVRVLTDYLHQHPESLFYGKGSR